MLWETISVQFHLEQSIGQQLCDSLDSTTALRERFRLIGGIFRKHISGNCVLALETKIHLVFQFMFHRSKCELTEHVLGQKIKATSFVKLSLV